MYAAELEIGNNLLMMFGWLIAAIPAIVAAVVSIRQNKELKPNGGSSMNDKVDKVYRTIVATDRVDDSDAPTVTVDKKA